VVSDNCNSFNGFNFGNSWTISLKDKMNNVITASRMNSLMLCPRAHFWAYEIGLQRESAGVALRFGSAWHRAMEARWKGATYEDALLMAIPEGIDLDDYACATLAGLLAGYYDYYGPKETVGKLEPEIQFDEPISEAGAFTMQGKIDGLGSLKDGRSVLIEAKTTGDQISPDSDYWLRLRFNLQVYQYVDAARKMGWDISEVIYDVTRKPSIKPKEVFDLDKNKLKIVIDSQGKRIYGTKKVEVTIGKGKKARKEKQVVEDRDKPRQSGDKEKGWTVKSHIETPDEFSERLWRDTLYRPDFYFVRREVPIIDSELQQFYNQRKALCGVVEHYREQQQTPFDQEAWPRNVSSNSCDFCAYKSFCLLNITVDINQPPQGYSIKGFNPELEQVVETPTTEII
jgi:hypothetical protein